MKKAQQTHILITGGTGFIGTPLCQRLAQAGYRLSVLTRSPQAHSQTESIRYITKLDELNNSPVDGIINLAGEPLAAKRWNEKRKQAFIDSRVGMTQQLVNYFKQQSHKPKVVINGSAIGFYGDRGAQILDEQASAGIGFAAELCQKWESSAQDFTEMGARLCIARIGVVLGHSGGPFVEIRKSYDFKVAARMGSGQQWMSWIHLDDMVAALHHLLEHDELSGTFNCTAPEPVTYHNLNQQMAKKTNAIIKLPLPAPIMRVLVGEMADEILLQGQRVMPQQLLATGFVFRYPNLSTALGDLLCTQSHD